MRGSQGEEGSRESRTNEGYKQSLAASAILLLSSEVRSYRLLWEILLTMLKKTLQEKSYWLKWMDVELEKGAKTMHTYLIYIIQNLQEGENTGSYKKTHLPANVPWNQKIRMSKNDLHMFFNINCHLKHIFFHVPYFWQLLLTKY